MDDINIVISDLDGTLLTNQKDVSIVDMKTLYNLGEEGIVRVIATGRNFFSARKSISDKFPIDYLIFSSGAGICNWKTKELIHSQYLPVQEVKEIANILIKNKVDFMVHEMVPENHKFVFHRSNRANPDFERRIDVYKEFAIELNTQTESYNNASQILAVFPNNLELFKEIENKFTDIKIIRTTSPLDGDSIWMEIFPKTVSKGHGIDWLCKHLRISQNSSLSIGNDFNDIDMLDYTQFSYIVENAPEELKNKYNICSSNQNNGFTDAVTRHIDFI